METFLLGRGNGIKEHPPLTKYLAGAASLFGDGYHVARIFFAICSSLACVLCFLWAERLFDRQTAWWAALLVIVSPHLIAHGRIVGHESLSLLFWAATGYASSFIKPNRRWAPVLVTGMLLGLAAAVRFTNGLLAVVVVVALVVDKDRKGWKDTFALLSIVAATSLVTFYGVWPKLWAHPVAGLREAWAVLGGLHGAEPFFGEQTNQPPLWYFLAYLAACVPIVVYLLAVVGSVFHDKKNRRPLFVVLALLLAPLVVSFSPVRQDGVRYILPCILALSIIASLGITVVARQFASQWPMRIAGTVAVVYCLVVGLRVHPYQLNFYSFGFGGEGRVFADRRFEIGWWGEGVQEAIDHVNLHAKQGDRVFKHCVTPSHLTWLRADLWATEAHAASRADWMIVYSPIPAR